MSRKHIALMILIPQVILWTLLLTVFRDDMTSFFESKETDVYSISEETTLRTTKALSSEIKDIIIDKSNLIVTQESIYTYMNTETGDKLELYHLPVFDGFEVVYTRIAGSDQVIDTKYYYQDDYGYYQVYLSNDIDVFGLEKYQIQEHVWNSDKILLVKFPIKVNDSWEGVNNFGYHYAYKIKSTMDTLVVPNLNIIYNNAITVEHTDENGNSEIYYYHNDIGNISFISNGVKWDLIEYKNVEQAIENTDNSL